MNKLKIYQNCFDEEALSKDLFEFDNSTRPLINELINKTITPELFKLVMKYLYNHYQLTPNEVLEYIKKYGVIITYNHTSTSKIPELLNPSLDEKIKTPLTLDKLKENINDSDFYATWFNPSDDIKTKNSLFNNLDQKYPSLTKDKIKAMISIQSNEYNYFSATTDLQGFYLKTNKTRYDIILADMLVNPCYTKFDFEIKNEDLDDFIKNIQINNPKERNSVISYSYVLMGYIAHYLISNNQLKFSIPLNKMYKSSFIKCVSMNRDAVYKLKFIKQDGDDIDYEVYPFKFTYQNQEYMFNKDGIKKIY